MIPKRRLRTHVLPRRALLWVWPLVRAAPILHKPKNAYHYSHIVARWSTSAMRDSEGLPTPAHKKERQGNQCGVRGHEEEEAEKDPDTKQRHSQRRLHG